MDLLNEEQVSAPAPEQTTPAVASENNAAPQAETPDASATSETSGDDAPATESKPERKREGGFQRRINELIAREREAQRERDHWRDMAMRGNPPQQPTAQGGAAPNATPKQEDFASYDEWQQAVIDHRVKATLDNERRAERERETRASAERTEAQRRASLQRAAAEAADKFADFEEVVAGADIPVTPAMVEAIDESDQKAALLYWLAKNPAEAKRIAGLSAAAQGRAIARAEITLAAQPQKTVTDAPEPPRTVSGKGTASADPSKMTPDQYRKWRESHSD